MKNATFTECLCALIFAITMVIITIAINRHHKDNRRPAIVKIMVYTVNWIRSILIHTRRTIRRIFNIPRTTVREISADEVPADIMREMLARRMCEVAKTAPHIHLDELEQEDEQCESEKTVITVTV